MKKNYYSGIDISKKTLDIVIYDPPTQKAKIQMKVKNNQKGYNDMLDAFIQNGISISDVFICLEHCGIYGLELGCFLEEKQVMFCFCSPLLIKKTMGLIRGKSDPLDAYKIAKFCYLYRDELHASKMPTSVMLEIKTLIAERNRLVKAHKVEKQVLTDLHSQLSEATLKRTKQRKSLLNSDIKAVEKEIISLVQVQTEIKTNFDLLKTIPGIGLINAVMMILCSNNFNGITNARAFACYCGVAPFEHTSGTSVKGKTRVSHFANKRMKADLTNAARSAIVHDPETRKYYLRKKAEGKAYGIIVNAVKFKLITRAFAVINRRTPFVVLRKAG